MRRSAHYLLISCILFCLSTFTFGKVEVAFTPGQAEQRVLLLINNAVISIDIAAYSFTSRNIAEALMQAAQRNVKIRIVADQKSNGSRYSVLKILKHQNINLRTIGSYAIMHNKFMLIDDLTIETGSFNYTKAAATANAENIVIITEEPQAMQLYQTEFMRLWNKASKYIPSS